MIGVRNSFTFLKQHKEGNPGAGKGGVCTLLVGVLKGLNQSIHNTHVKTHSLYLRKNKFLNFFEQFPLEGYQPP